MGRHSIIRNLASNPGRAAASTRPWHGLVLLAALALGAQPIFAVTAHVSDDMETNQGRAQAPGATPSLAIGGRSITYLKFDLDTLPENLSGAGVAKATLDVWVSRVDKPGSVDVFRLRDDWNESRGGTRRDPRLGELIYQGFPVSASNQQGFLSIDITPLVSAWVDGSLPNQGVALVAGDTETRFVIDSKENRAGGHEPSIEISLGLSGGGPSSTLPILGPPGPQGVAGPAGPTGPPGAALNQGRIAVLRWYEANQASISAATGNQPSALVFDGVDLWVTNFLDNTVKKHRTINGTVIGTVIIGAGPSALAFDGLNMWVANKTANTVQKLQATNGAILGTFPVGTAPDALAFDGTYIWVANSGSDDLTKMRAIDGFVVGTYPVGNDPEALVFDGTNIWVANTADNTVMTVRPSDGAVLETFATGNAPKALTYDGVDVWVAESGDATVSKVRATDGAPQGTFNVGASPSGIVFDGEFIWVTNTGGNSVTKLQASDGALRGTFTAGSGPRSIAFDGVFMWVVNSTGNTLSKL